MGKARKNYERVDFSELLAELRGEGKEIHPEEKKENIESEENYIETKEEKKKANDVVTAAEAARRRRASLMDCLENKYAYSKTELVLHDRDCIFVKSIPDEEFEMISDFNEYLPYCPCCYRQMLIRAGIGDDRKKIKAYYRFFEETKVSNRKLHYLMIENQARVLFVNKDCIFVRVREDDWLLKREDGVYRLFHNNYILVGETERHFTDGYHEQKYLGKKDNVHNAINAICRYSWEEHISLREKETTKEEVLEKVEDSFDEQAEEPTITEKTIVLEVLKEMESEPDKKTEKTFTENSRGNWFKRLIRCLRKK